MGYSVELMGLITELVERGHLQNVKKVVDLGSQEMHFTPRDLNSDTCKEAIRTAIYALSGTKISDEQLTKLAKRSPARDFYHLASKEYKALDADGWYGESFDFNFDHVEEGDKNAYCLTVNAGTSEHLIDQKNIF